MKHTYLLILLLGITNLIYGQELVNWEAIREHKESSLIIEIEGIECKLNIKPNSASRKAYKPNILT